MREEKNMYLNELASEQKELFLDLCICLSESDEDFSQEEKDTIDKFCIEMGNTARYVANNDVEMTLDKLNDISSDVEKRSITLEIMGIVLADGSYDDGEKAILEKLASKFSIEYSEIEKMIQVISDLYKIYGKFNLFLNGERI